MRVRRSDRWGRAPILSMVCAALLALTFVSASTPAFADGGLDWTVTNYDNDGTNGVYLRGSANVNDVTRDAAHYLTYGTKVHLICGTFGSAVGPHANTAWDQVKVMSGPNVGRVGYLSEHWLNTPVGSNQHVSGEPQCGSVPSPAPVGSRSTKIWFGAPFTGHWAGTPHPVDARPEWHNPLYGIPGQSYTSDWAMDYYAPAGTAVAVYAAPKDASLSSGITAQVLQVRAGCRSRSVSEGGYLVQVGIYDRGVEVGVLSYMHVNPDFNRDGRTTSSDLAFRGKVSRWGGYIGTVGKYVKSSCWAVNTASGTHVHFEAANLSHYSCFRGGVPNNATLASHSYIGYLGGWFVYGKKRACPSGA